MINGPIVADDKTKDDIPDLEDIFIELEDF